MGTQKASRAPKGQPDKGSLSVYPLCKPAAAKAAAAQDNQNADQAKRRKPAAPCVKVARVEDELPPGYDLIPSTLPGTEIGCWHWRNAKTGAEGWKWVSYRRAIEGAWPAHTIFDRDVDRPAAAPAAAQEARA
jgi:hypothetical protein